jgi:hypothetical protein
LRRRFGGKVAALEANGEADQAQEHSALKGGLLSLLAHCEANGEAGQESNQRNAFPRQT